jgi:hypothetical protein
MAWFGEKILDFMAWLGQEILGPTPQATVWPHPLAPRSVVPESADKTPRPEHGPVKPQAYPVSLVTPNDAEYSATCTICGGMAKPGGKCLSCGEQAPAPLTEEQLCAGDREMFAAIEPQAQEAAQPEPELPPHGVDTSWNNGFQGEELQKEILKARERQLLEAQNTIAQLQSGLQMAAHFFDSPESFNDDEFRAVAQAVYFAQDGKRHKYTGKVPHLSQRCEAQNTIVQLRGLNVAQSKIILGMQKRNDSLQQQLAQIRSAKSERPKAGYSDTASTYLKTDVDSRLDSRDQTIAALKQLIEYDVQFRSQIMLMLDKVGIPTTEHDSDKHSRFLTTRARIEKLIAMYEAKDARIAAVLKSAAEADGATGCK